MLQSPYEHKLIMQFSKAHHF